MNTIFKTDHLYLLLISFILITFSSCEEKTLKDFNPQNEQLDRIDFTIHEGKYLYENDKNLKQTIAKIKNNMQKSTTSSIYNFGIYESSVQVLEATNYTQYTFEMYRATAITNQLENYVLKIYDDDSNEQFIVTYDLNPDYSYNFNDIEAINDPSLITPKTFGCSLEFVNSFENTVCSPIYCSVNGHEDGGNGCWNNPDEGGQPNPDLGLNCETYTVNVFKENCGGGTDGGTTPGDPSVPPIGGNTGPNNNDDSPDLSDPETTATRDFTIISQCTKDAINNLPQDQADWINGLNDCDPFALSGTTSCNRDLYEDIASFINSNSDSCELNAEAGEFLNAVKDAIEEDPDVEVDFEDRIIKEDEFLENECLNTVYNQLNTSDVASNFLSNFEGHHPVAHLLFSVGVDSLYPNANAVTYPPDNFVIEIMFNPNQLDRPSTDVARTFMHEIIHAEIYRKLLSLAQQGEIPWTASFIQTLRNDFPGLQDYYTRWWLDTGGQSPNSTQHELMAQHYRNTISNFLLQFDTSLSESQANALAWVGLMGSGNFNPTTGLFLNSTVAWQNVNLQDRLNIVNIITNYHSNNPDC